MALKGLRKYDEGTDIAYIMNVVAERGIVVIHDPNSTGTGKPGDANNVLVIPSNASGVPLGILACDVVDINLSQFPHLARFRKDEVPICSPVTVVTHGYVYTNMVASGVTPTPGAAAHFTTNGRFTTTTTSARVGRFRGQLDADGYVGVDVTVGV